MAPTIAESVMATDVEYTLSIEKRYVFKTSLSQLLHDGQLLTAQVSACRNCVNRSHGGCYCKAFAEKIGTTPAYSIDELQSLKAELLSVQSKLSDIDISEWQKHTQKTDKYAAVVPSIRKKGGRGSNTSFELVTNGWIKMYEILANSNMLNITSLQDAKVKALHLCECPGGFICATNHYIKTVNDNNQFDWRAISLNPYYEGNDPTSTINDDMLYRCTHRNWLNGEDDSGNIMSKANIEHIWKETSRSKRPWMASLITADGSIGVQHDPAKQEEITAPLHYAELVCGLGVLSVGGNFIIKMFTLCQHHSISILSLMSMLFKQIAVVKPQLSKSGNSEVYVMGYHFLGIRSVLLKSLIHLVGDELPKENAIIPREWIPNNFMDEVAECVSDFTKWQIGAISENLRLWNDGISDVLMNSMLSSKNSDAEEYIESLSLRPISRSDCVASRHLSANDRHLAGSMTKLSTEKDKLEKVGGMLSNRLQQFSETWMQQQKRKERWNTNKRTFVPPEPITTSTSSLLSAEYSYEMQFELVDSKWFSLYASSTERKKEDFYSNETNDFDILRDCIKMKLLRQEYTKQTNKWLVFSNEIEPYEFKYSKFVNKSLLNEFISLRTSMESPLKTISPGDILCQTSHNAGASVSREGQLSRGALDVLLCLHHFGKYPLQSLKSYKIYLEVISNTTVFQEFPVTSLFKRFSKDGFIVRLESENLIGETGRLPSNVMNVSKIDLLKKQLDSLKGDGRILGCTCIPLVTTSTNSANEHRSPRSNLVTAIQRMLEAESGVCDFVFLDVIGGTPNYTEILTGEIATKWKLVNQLLLAFNALSAGGDLLIHLGTVYTRFTAGVVLMLGIAFDRVRICRPSSSSPWKLTRYLFCENFKDQKDSAVRRFLQYIFDGMWLSQMSCLQIMEPLYWTTSCFCDWLASVNNELIQQEIQDCKLRREESLAHPFKWEGIEEFLAQSGIEKYPFSTKDIKANTYRHQPAYNEESEELDIVMDPWDGKFRVIENTDEVMDQPECFDVFKMTDSLWEGSDTSMEGA